MQAEKRETKEKLAAFAHRLGILAGRKRLRQVEIARRLDTAENPVSAQRVGSWFQGRNFPGGDVEYALAALLGVSREWLIDGKNDKETTETTGTKDAALPQDSEVVVNRADYRDSGSQSTSDPGGENQRSFAMLDPRFQPRAEPTPEMCASHFAEFLDKAKQAPGGVGFTWRLLQKHFPLDEFDPKGKAP